MSQRTSESYLESRAPWYLVAFLNAGSIRPIVIPYNSVVLCEEARARLHATSSWWCAVCIPGDDPYA